MHCSGCRIYKHYLNNLSGDCLGSTIGKDAVRCSARRRHRIGQTYMAWVRPQAKKKKKNTLKSVHLAPFLKHQGF